MRLHETAQTSTKNGPVENSTAARVMIEAPTLKNINSPSTTPSINAMELTFHHQRGRRSISNHA
jgi:hypothetical protein